MTREEAISTLESESCYECTWGCESPAKCDCPKCDLKSAVKTAIEVLRTEKICPVFSDDEVKQPCINCLECELERPHEKWEYLKEQITELRDANGYATQYGTCQFILNLMGVIEREGDRNGQTTD